jgi:hypothetical protein
MSEVNVPLLKATMAIIDMKPEEHDQSNWVEVTEESPCGTTMCFAGHAAVLAGAEIPNPKKHDIRGWYLDKQLNYLNSETGYYNDEARTVGSFSMEQLGIDERTANYLFDATLSTAGLRHAVDELIEFGEIRTWEDPFREESDDYYCCAACG